jgi:amino acid permease
MLHETLEIVVTLEHTHGRERERQDADGATHGANKDTPNVNTKPEVGVAPLRMGAPSGGLSWLMAVTTILKTQWGIGMMAMPFMIQQAGLLAGVLQFMLAMVLTVDVIFRLLAVRRELIARQSRGGTTSGERLIEDAASPSSATEPPPPPSLSLDYNGTVRGALGPRLECLSLFAIFVSCYGSNIAFAIFIGTNLHQFLPHVPLLPWQWLFIVGVPLWLGLASRRDVRFLAPFGVIGLLCAVGFEGVMLADTASTLGWSGFAKWVHSTPLVRPSTLPIAVSIAAFCNEGVVIMSLSVVAAMRTPASFPSAMLTALGVFTTCYLALGVAGAALFDGHVVAPISKAFSRTPMHTVAAVLYALQLLPTYSLVLWMGYESLEEATMRMRRVKSGSTTHSRMRSRLFLPLRWLAVVLSVLLAAAVPSFGDFLALQGAFANSLSIYILPHVCWLRTFAFAPAAADGGATLKLSGAPPSYFVARCAVSCAVIALGLTLAVYGTYSSIIGMLHPPAANLSSSRSVPH